MTPPRRNVKETDIASPTWKCFHPQILVGREKYEKNAFKEEATSSNVIVQAFTMISSTHLQLPAITHCKRGLSCRKAPVMIAGIPTDTPHHHMYNQHPRCMCGHKMTPLAHQGDESGEPNGSPPHREARESCHGDLSQHRELQQRHDHRPIKDDGPH